MFDLSERLRYHGWLVPAYTLPENLTNVAVLRVVVKEGFTRELADLLLNDIQSAVKFLEKQPKPVRKEITTEDKEKGGFHH